MRIRELIKNPFIWAFFLGIGSLHIIKEMALRHQRAPEPLVYIEPWQLNDQDGHVLSQQKLKGKIVIANFFFTSCLNICPKLTEAMKEVYKRFLDKQDKITFLSITVDPETDTFLKLKNFMNSHQINYSNWFFLTGTKQEIYQVVVEKMQVHMSNKSNKEKIAEGIYDVPHLAKLALFDQNGNLRGLFNTESIELAALVRAANFLMN